MILELRLDNDSLRQQTRYSTVRNESVIFFIFIDAKYNARRYILLNMENIAHATCYFCHIRLLKTDVTMTSRYPSSSSPPDKFDRFVYSDFKCVASTK